MLPVVEAARISVFGDRSYSSALSGCEALDPDGEWIHPTTLALTVYGDAQALLADAFGQHGPEVLPGYAEIRRGESELLCVADFLLAVSEREKIEDHEVRVFRFDAPHVRYSLKSGWVSGLTQGIVGQVFLGAYLAGEDRKYLIAARETGKLLAVSVEGGGTRIEMQNGSAWYEEYAQSGTRQPLVLNGHFLALDFLYWMTQFEDESDWGEMFDSGLQAVVARIGNYQGFSWSYYDEQSNFATRKYQSFHVRQLSRYSIHDDTGALTHARDVMRWQLLVPVGIFQRLIVQPSRLLLFLTGLFFVVYLPGVWFACLVSAKIFGSKGFYA